MPGSIPPPARHRRRNGDLARAVNYRQRLIAETRYYSGRSFQVFEFWSLQNLYGLRPVSITLRRFYGQNILGKVVDSISRFRFAGKVQTHQDMDLPRILEGSAETVAWPTGVPVPVPLKSFFKPEVFLLRGPTFAKRSGFLDPFSFCSHLPHVLGYDTDTDRYRYRPGWLGLTGTICRWFHVTIERCCM